LAALPYINHSVELHLRGGPTKDYESWLAASVQPAWRSRIFLHDLVPPNELISRIAEHDIGFAGEMKFCRNRELTVTNKILQYLLAGLAVVSSDTFGQLEVAEQAPGAVFVYPSGDPIALAGQLNHLLGSADRLQSARKAALHAAEYDFCWERQEPKLVKAIFQALQPATLVA
jgi:hypothetical protein